VCMTRTLTHKYTHINMHTHTNIDTHIDTQILVHIQEQTYRLSCFCARMWKQRRFSKYHVAAAQAVCVLSHMHVMIWFFHSFLSLKLFFSLARSLSRFLSLSLTLFLSLAFSLSHTYTNTHLLCVLPPLPTPPLSLVPFLPLSLPPFLPPPLPPSFSRPPSFFHSPSLVLSLSTSLYASGR